MKKDIFMLVWIILIIMLFSDIVYGKAKPEKGSIILTTMDVEGIYEVVDIVTYRTSLTDIDELIRGIKKAAKRLKADAVIGLRFVNYGDFFYAYGTAVAFKK